MHSAKISFKPPWLKESLSFYEEIKMNPSEWTFLKTACNMKIFEKIENGLIFLKG